MTDFKRTLTQHIPQDYSAFIFGPRLSGKSTILKKIKHLLYIDLLEKELLLNYNINPGYLFEQVEALPKKAGIIIIDEIQKVPALLDEIQRVVDKYPKIHFLLSGSSARKLKRHAANLLGGRALNLSLYPLSLEEIGKDFNLDLILQYGSLPRIYKLLLAGKENLAQNILRAYVTIYLSEEIKEESVVRKLDSFQRFLEVAAFQYAKDVNLDALAEEAKISAGACRNYYSILEDTLLGFFLYPYERSIRKQLTKTPKFYFFDNGVTRALNQQLSTKPSNQEQGLLFEQWFIMEVKKLNSYYNKDFSLNFWRTVAGSEVDLIITRGRDILAAIEIKRTPHPSERDVTGLKSFHEEYKNVPCYLCAPVKQELLLAQKFRVCPPQALLQKLKEL